MKANGRTARFDAVGCQYMGTLLPFGETVLFGHGDTLDVGIFVGAKYDSDEYLVGTAEGVVEGRTVRRMTADKQADKEALARTTGSPHGRCGTPSRSRDECFRRGWGHRQRWSRRRTRQAWRILGPPLLGLRAVGGDEEAELPPQPEA